jgi:Flp pilus assembly pilin Flp
MNNLAIRRLAAITHLLAGRARRALDERNRQRGASVIEWVVISAVVLGIAIAVGVILKNALTQGATNVSNSVTSNTN